VNAKLETGGGGMDWALRLDCVHSFIPLFILDVEYALVNETNEAD
jgi:hypothetical protein